MTNWHVAACETQSTDFKRIRLVKCIRKVSLKKSLRDNKQFYARTVPFYFCALNFFTIKIYKDKYILKALVLNDVRV